MSRVGNKIINVPEGVKVEIADDNTVTVTGAKGTLVRQFSPLININMDENVITVSRTSEQKHVKQLHGTTRALLANMIEGVHNGYKKELEVVGIGYRAQMQGNKLVLNGLGIVVLSTSQGLMTDKEARAKQIGGEVLAYIW